jgi:hypothetical protein
MFYVAPECFRMMKELGCLLEECLRESIDVLVQNRPEFHLIPFRAAKSFHICFGTHQNCMFMTRSFACFPEKFSALRASFSFVEMSVTQMNHEIKLVKSRDGAKASASFAEAVGPVLAYGQVDNCRSTLTTLISELF